MQQHMSVGLSKVMYDAYFIPSWANYANKFTLYRLGFFYSNKVRKSSTETKRRMTWRGNVLRGRPSIWTVWRTRTLGQTCRPARCTSYTPPQIRRKLTVDAITPLSIKTQNFGESFDVFTAASRHRHGSSEFRDVDVVQC